MLDYFNSYLNKFSMYRLITYFLLIIIALSIILSFVGVIHYQAIYMIIALVILIISGYLFNQLFSNIFDAPINPESNIITSLILFLIISPVYHNIFSIGFLILASLIAQASKYIFTYKDNHIFNPAAVSVLLMDYLARQSASWWVGNFYLTPLVILGGLLIIKKISNYQMIFVFLSSNLIFSLLIGFLYHDPILNLENTLISSPLFFLGFVMLTEPITSPKNKHYQIIYALIVSILLLPQIHIGSFYTSPELALIVGNIFAFLVADKNKLFLYLKQKIIVNGKFQVLYFDRPIDFKFIPGQYMEWTLSHDHYDSKGVRRYLTIASSPTESNLILAMKIQEPLSSFKNSLLTINHPLMIASNLGGDFILNNQPYHRIIFIAGGVGITPFRSMIKYLIDSNQKKNIVLFYFVRNEKDVLFHDVFQKAHQILDIKINYVITGNYNQKFSYNYSQKGKLDKNFFSQYFGLDNQQGSVFYLSGSSSMVKKSKSILKSFGLTNQQIKTDSFSGY